MPNSYDVGQRTIPIGILVVLTSLGAATALAQPSEIVIVQGTTTEQSNLLINAPGLDRDRSGALATSLGMIVGGTVCSEAAAWYGSVIAAIGGGLGADVEDARRAICNPQPDKSSNYLVIYSACSMTMWSGDTAMRLVLPSDGSDAQMLLFFVDETGPSVRRLNMARVFSGPGSAAIERGMLFNVSVEPRGGSRELLGVSTREYAFSYSGGAGEAALPADFLGGRPIYGGGFQLGSEGTAWLAPAVPGLDVVGAFYRNFEREVVPPEEARSLLGGMIAHLARLTQQGFPLQISQRTGVALVAGSSVPLTFGESWQSETTVTGVTFLIVESDWCQVNDIPTDWRVINITEATTSSAAPTGAGGAASSAAAAGAAAAAAAAGASAAGVPGAQQMPDLQGAMNAANQAMQDMTPEQRAQMQALTAGFGQLFSGLAANEALVSGGGAAAAEGSAAQANAMQSVGAGLAQMLTGLDGGQGNVRVLPPGSAQAGAAATAARPSSASLMTDDLTQSAQNLLQALGYDPGNTDGEPVIQTTIAISQFQAEKGLQVTGAVTPQLIGILAAEVDAP